MNVFVPYKSPLDCAKALYGDKRFNKQIIECRQILDAIDGAKAWRNHPVCLMYKEHKKWLECYMNTFLAYKRFMNSTSKHEFVANYGQALIWNDCANNVRPPFITNELCDQHKRRLYTKSPELYPQFAEYGTSEENWYSINEQIVKYINGKRIKE